MRNISELIEKLRSLFRTKRPRKVSKNHTWDYYRVACKCGNSLIVSKYMPEIIACHKCGGVIDLSDIKNESEVD